MARLPILRRARAALATLRGLLAEEWFLGVGLASSAALLLGGEALTDRLSAPAGLAMLFAWLFVAAFGCCLSVVRHADHLAIRLGEPYGTLILTLAVTTVEVTSISSMVVHGARDPALARDTVFAVIMILLNGMVGLSLLLGGWRHLEQQFNLLGANSYLGVIIPLTALSLLLPNYTLTTAGPTLSASQEIFVAAVALGLYAVFLAVQTIRHRGYFRLVDAGEREDHEPPQGRLAIRCCTPGRWPAIWRRWSSSPNAFLPPSTACWRRCGRPPRSAASLSPCSSPPPKR